MDNKEAIKLLDRIGKGLDFIKSKTFQLNNPVYDKASECIGGLAEALALLKPACKTCNDSGSVWITKGRDDEPDEAGPCPVCKPARSEPTGEVACSTRCGESACDCREAYFSQLKSERDNFESLYSTATKALNSQIELVEQLKEKLDYPHEEIAELQAKNEQIAEELSAETGRANRLHKRSNMRDTEIEQLQAELKAKDKTIEQQEAEIAELKKATEQCLSLCTVKEDAELIVKLQAEIEGLKKWLRLIRKSTEIMESRRFADQALQGQEAESNRSPEGGSK